MYNEFGFGSTVFWGAIEAGERPRSNGRSLSCNMLFINKIDNALREKRAPQPAQPTGPTPVLGGPKASAAPNSIFLVTCGGPPCSTYARPGRTTSAPRPGPVHKLSEAV